jgi:CRP-like cAMP-binding protein
MRVAATAKGSAKRLKEIISFRFLSDEEAAKLCDYVEFVVADEGELIVREGEVSPWFYGILSGTMSVEVEQGDASVFVCALGPGDIFGEAGIFISVPRTANVIAREGGELARIRREDMTRFIKENPLAGNKILMVIIHGLLRKLKAVNHELAFERRADLDQEDIDAMMKNIMEEGA